MLHYVIDPPKYFILLSQHTSEFVWSPGGAAHVSALVQSLEDGREKVELNLHDVFTQFKQWYGGKKPQGIGLHVIPQYGSCIVGH